ncbi:hypothetical protein CC86DRAFT_386235 [Ophiobolus disseminans]|uniref:Uncharacterized protein n=1 Tax=Ophiobolus disseminans TaxID=1469910 RepID=A0A6A6ZL91_9PLEO|nr:hypothetical protein CC86DRAFT_386235 [Ophiobolus disseminans]
MKALYKLSLHMSANAETRLLNREFGKKPATLPQMHDGAPSDQHVAISAEQGRNTSEITRRNSYKISQWKIPTSGDIPLDRAIIEKFELAHTSTTAVPTDIDWQWPTKANGDWMPIRNKTDKIPMKGLAGLMAHIWTTDCSHESNGDQKERRESQEYLDSLWPWSQFPPSIVLYFPDREAPEKGKGKQPVQDNDEDLDWMSTASMDVDFGDTLADPRFTYHRTPKKLHSPLTIDPHGTNPPIGWAIWIDKNFAVPWYLPLALAVHSVAVFVFAIWYTAETAPKANGWVIGSFVFTPVSLVFGVWVLKARIRNMRGCDIAVLEPVCACVLLGVSADISF